MDQFKHERIDKGISRPRASVPRRRDPETDRMQGIPEGLQASEVLEAYLTEQTTSQIALRYGMARKTMVAWLREVAPEEWKRVQVIRAMCRKEDADEGLEQACDALSLARAREQLKSGQWDLERLDSANYGVKPEAATQAPPVFQVIINTLPTSLPIDQPVDILPLIDPK